MVLYSFKVSLACGHSLKILLCHCLLLFFRITGVSTIFIRSIQSKNQKAFNKAEITDEKARTNGEMESEIKGEQNKTEKKKTEELRKRKSRAVCVWRYVLSN